MANNPKKIQDATEAALSAIQEALEVRTPESQPKDSLGRESAAKESPAPAKTEPESAPEVRRRWRNGSGDNAEKARPPVAAEDEEIFGDQPAIRAVPRGEEAAARRPAANDDRQSIGAILQAVQRRPSRMSYTVAAIFSAAWLVAGIGVAWIYMPQIEAVTAGARAAAPVLLGLGALYLLPVFFFFALAHMVSRANELRMIAQSMAQVSIRLAEPETVARESIVSVGQAIRREVAAMGDGVERALARAAELEALVHNEVSALERAYNDNEVRIRGMLQDLASQRDTLVSQAEQVRNAISSVHLDLSQDITSVSDLVAERVSETAQRITHTLADKGEHITLALGRAGDSMINALTERGGDLLERLETTSDQTTHAIATASERLMASLNFRTDHIHAEFSGLANNLTDSVTSQLGEVSREFEQRSQSVIDTMGNRTREMAASIVDASAGVAETIADRVEEVNSTLKATGDSLVLDLSLRGSDVVANLDQTGKRITEALVANSSKVTEALAENTSKMTEALAENTNKMTEALNESSQKVTDTFRDDGDALARTVEAKGEAIKNMLAARLMAFEEMFTHGGAELGEKITRESTTLGNLITRNLSEFDRTVKTYGGELVERLGQRTEEVSEAMRTYVDGFDSRVSGRAEEVENALERRLVRFEEALDGRSRSLDQSLESRVAEIGNIISIRGASIADTLAAKMADIDRSLGERAVEVTASIDRSVNRVEELNASIKSHTGDAERALSTLSANISSTLKQNADDVERTLLGVSAEVARTFIGKADEITAAVSARAAEMTGVLDQSSTGLLSALTNKSEEFAAQVGRATDHALSEIDSRGYIFSQALTDHSQEITRGITEASAAATRGLTETSAQVARGITEASTNATATVTRTLQDLQDAARTAIEQSKQTASATVSEMLETHGMLRSDTTTLFERLREANILLQEVLSGAHENMSSLENTLVTRVSEFVSTLNQVTEKSGAASNKVEEQIGKFSTVTTRVLGDLGQLAAQFDAHGRGLAEAVELIDRSNRRTEEVIGERRAGLDGLVATLDLRTEDMEQRLRSFTGLLDETLESAGARAHEIARIVSEASTGGAQAIAEQFNLVRSTVDEERKRTAEAMRGIYEDARKDTTEIFRQSTDRFTDVIRGMKHMASEMQRELETTRAELRRGILELPQETAESAAQMRRVIVDQIEALAELNRIVARHGRGMDVVEPARRVATGGGREESAPPAFERERMDVPRPAPRREAPARAEGSGFGSNSNNNNSTPRRAETPTLGASAGTGGRPSGWLTDLLQRASRDDEPGAEKPREAAPTTARDERNPRHSIESLDSLSVDIARMIDHEAAAELWDRYKRGERNVFTRRLYTLQGQKAFDDISKKYRADREFRQTVDRYITEFERLLDEVSRDDRGQVVARTYLTSETGKVYTMLAHAAGRFESH